LKKLRFAVFGTGFWANYQIPAWYELEGIELVALYNRTKSKAETVAHKFNVPRVYDDPDKLLKNEQLDFVDIITDVDTHVRFTTEAARKGVHVICQKPMAPKFPQAQLMVRACQEANVGFYIHENWRWQTPIRKVKEVLTKGSVGKVFKARVTFCSAFPVFENQPFLAELDEFILTDIGSHILDVCRFLFGEVEYLQCHTLRVNPKIKGEDVANVFMKMKDGTSCFAEMSYASILERESFPQTLISIEGSNGSIQLTYDYQIKITTREETTTITAVPPQYDWADPAYALVHSSIVDCNRNILNGLLGQRAAETTGIDNLETVKLVHNAYRSAREKRVINYTEFSDASPAA
jgi:D-apiose dehydrogenase